MNNIDNSEIFFKNIGMLYNKDTIFEIIPTETMNNSQKINAIIRFSLFKT